MTNPIKLVRAAVLAGVLSLVPLATGGRAMISSRSIRVALLAVLVFGQACFHDKPTGLDPARDGTIPNSESLSVEQLGEDPLSLDLAEEIPGFAGIYYEPPGSDRLVIALTEANTDFRWPSKRSRLVCQETPLAR